MFVFAERPIGLPRAAKDRYFPPPPKKLREPRSDCEHDRLAQRMAKLEEQLFAAMEGIGTLEAENARLRKEHR